MKTENSARVGHVHLRVSDLHRAVAFYRDLLGFEVQQRAPGAAFLGAGGYHHHIRLNTWQSLGAEAPPEGHTGLFHSAFLYPDRKALAHVLKRVVAAGVEIDGAADHGVSEAVYFRDPDNNGVEIYVDKPKANWPRDADGRLAMINKRLDVAALLALAD